MATKPKPRELKGIDKKAKDHLKKSGSDFTRLLVCKLLRKIAAEME